MTHDPPPDRQPLAQDRAEDWAGPAELALTAFLLGLITPGSPVDRGPDALTSGPDREAADVVAEALRGRPGSVLAPERADETPRLGPNVHTRRGPSPIRRREGSATLDVIAALVCAGIGAALLLARGL